MNAQTQYLPLFHRWELSSSLYHNTKMLHIDDTGGSCRCRKHTITHVDTRGNHYYMDTLLRTVSEMTLAKKTSPRLAPAKKTL